MPFSAQPLTRRQFAALAAAPFSAHPLPEVNG